MASGAGSGRYVGLPSQQTTKAAKTAPAPWELEYYFGARAEAPIGAPASDAEGCRVQLSPTEQRERRWSSRHNGDDNESEGSGMRPERPRSVAFCDALRQFLHTGVCWLESGALPEETVRACKRCAASHLLKLRGELGRQKRKLLHSNGEGDPGDHRMTALLRCDFAELTERDGGRVDMRYRMNEPPFSDPSIVRCKLSTCGGDRQHEHANPTVL